MFCIFNNENDALYILIIDVLIDNSRKKTTNGLDWQ